MSTIEAISLLGPTASVSRSSGAPPESSAATASEWFVLEWNAVQDQLIGLAPQRGELDQRIDDDGYMLPSGQAIASASQIAARLKNQGQSAPTTIVQDPIGGIIFEWTWGECVERLIINRRGEMEVVSFCKSQMVFRQPASIMRNVR